MQTGSKQINGLKVYSFQKENKIVLVGDSLKLFIENKEIDRIGAGCKNECFKFVGIHLDETWNHHVKAVKNKASSAVFALSNVRNLLPSNIKHTIYNSLFRSFV